jgi:hypothetical protein
VYPSIGRFESGAFDPKTWKPHAPTTAYVEMQPDDAFWAARRVAAFDDDLIRAIVREGRFSDPAAERHLAGVLMERRDKIARAYLADVNPLVNPKLSAAGELTFENAASAVGGGEPTGYLAVWRQFDNASGDTRPLGESRGAQPLRAPGGLPSSTGDMVQIDVSGADRPEWQPPARLHFRRAADGWALVGLDRSPR